MALNQVHFSNMNDLPFMLIDTLKSSIALALRDQFDCFGHAIKGFGIQLNYIIFKNITRHNSWKFIEDLDIRFNSGIIHINLNGFLACNGMQTIVNLGSSSHVSSSHRPKP